MDGQQQIWLEITTPSGRTSRHEFEGARLVVGRAQSAAVCLDHNTVSRKHAALYQDPFGRWWVRDLGSSNGTAVNGRAISEQVIHQGDAIEVGQFTLKVLTLGGERPAPEPQRDASASAASASVTLCETDQTIASLPEVTPPRIAVTQVSALSDLVEKLLLLEEPSRRMQELCRLMVRQEFRGLCAVVLRLRHGEEETQPEALCPLESSSRWRGGQPHLSRTLLRALCDRGEPLLGSNSPHHRGASAHLSLSRDVMAIAAVGCPLRGDELFTDVLYVILPPECGTGEWLALATLAARQYRHAETIWAARRQQAAHAAVERELEQARQVQRRLIPLQAHVAGLDIAIGFKPCRWVGGDYVDVVQMPDGRVLMTLADVCGKGMPAALIAHSLHTALYIAVRAAMPPAELMRDLSEYIEVLLAGERFVTMVAILADPRTGKLEYLNAGHPAPLVLGPDGQVRVCGLASIPPLGMGHDLPQSEPEQILPGEMLVMYTDGLPDLSLRSGERLGEERLREELGQLYSANPGRSAQEMADDFSKLLDDLADDTLCQDDRAFLFARRT